MGNAVVSKGRSVRKRSGAIRSFVLRRISETPYKIAARTAAEFGISISSANSHIRTLVDDQLLIAEGNTRARTYRLPQLDQDNLVLDLTLTTDESIVWETWLSLKLTKDSSNVRAICQHGFTEILNNAIDHSESEKVQVRYSRTPVSIEIVISDFGIGIFRKIATAFSLESNQQALLELAKGKLTTDPDRHSGEGIFFTSRMFDHFAIVSGALYFSHDSKDDWLLEDRPAAGIGGTYVFMTIDIESERTTREVFDQFTSDFDDYGFTKTHVPVRMMLHEGDRLVSRSQARRLLARVDRFSEVMLDFEGVEEVGQAFADEIFRVFAGSHPKVELIPLRASQRVRQMIRRARNQN